ncbi:hypothetical protein AB3N59_19460 [Leptospira sp. WS92.C1]
MSEILIICTLLILSPTELKLISERMNLRNGHSEGKAEFFFKNTKSGFFLFGDRMSVIKGTEPSRDCIINLSEKEGGFLDVCGANFPKNLEITKGLSHLELTDLCKSASIRK